jgi:aerobic-type carbon monoxide dehydrogenase small subunit (CoxS/CutS family)
MIEVIKFELNGSPVEITVDPNSMLLWVLRNDLVHTGTKFGCGMGFCGSCTVIMNGEPMRSCTTPVSDAKGKKVLTIEGLAKNGSLHPIQKEFMALDALQCGYCTPGMIMNAYGLLLKNPEPSKTEVIEAMEENLCRCGTHGRIIQAIQKAGRQMKGGKL